jgi:hypothetical protein
MAIHICFTVIVSPLSPCRERIYETGKVFNYANPVFIKYISVRRMFTVDASPVKLPGFYQRAYLPPHGCLRQYRRYR